MQKIEYIFNHHSASDWGDAAEIDKWHKEKGWKGIGYHYVVLNGYISYQDLKNHQISQYDIGKVEKGRASGLYSLAGSRRSWCSCVWLQQKFNWRLCYSQSRKILS
jgi:hypothetical protein